jgi:hypothetical protein
MGINSVKMSIFHECNRFEHCCQAHLGLFDFLGLDRAAYQVFRYIFCFAKGCRFTPGRLWIILAIIQ